MAYPPTTWVEKVTKVGPTNLNKLELGLQAAAAVADAALPTPAGSDGQFLQRAGGLWVPHALVAADMPSGIALSKLTDPGSGKVVTSAGAGAIAAFPPGYKFDKTAFTAAVTGIAGVNIAGATSVVTSGSVTYDGATEVCIEFWCPYVTITTANFRLKFELFEDATDIGELGTLAPSYTGQIAGPRLALFRTPSNAAHTYTVKVFVPDGGTGVIGAGAGGGATVVPGWIRVTKSA